MSFRPFRFCRRGLISLIVLGMSLPALAANIKIEAKLIWGTNEDRDYQKDKGHKRVDEVTTAKLTNCFKWKSYWQINTIVTNIPSRGTVTLKMSEPCTIKITELEGPKIELELIGKGKPVTRAVKSLVKGELTTIGGEDKNGSAWFVLINQLE
jgi:hypothetical protein